MEFLMLFERGEEGYGAYVPDLPGCIAAGSTRDEVASLIREAIQLHVTELREDGQPVPAPTTTSETVAVIARVSSEPLGDCYSVGRSNTPKTRPDEL